MARNGNAHPGRSVDFLSRLHDGELEPGERARFEVHRAHCAECRRAAIEFGDAISLFRSARSSPPRADLAARILHKVQSTHRSRTPFTARFRTDLGWAALLVTAILAVLISTPIVIREQDAAFSPPPSAEPTPPAVDEDLRAAAPAEARASADSRQERDEGASGPAARRPAPEVKKQALKDESRNAVAPKEEISRSARDAAEPPSAARERENRASSRMAAESGRAGGEGEGALASPSAKAVRVSIEPADGFGPAPALVSPTRLELSAAERGREYFLFVDAQGAVREVSPARRGKERSARAPAAAAPEIAAVEAAPPASLLELRFQPGNRPRRLLIRFD